MKNFDCVISEYNIKRKMTGNLTPQELLFLGEAYYFKNNLTMADTDLRI